MSPLKFIPPPLLSLELWALAAHIHPPRPMKPAPYLREMFRQELAKDCVRAATTFHRTVLTSWSSSMLDWRNWATKRDQFQLSEPELRIKETDKDCDNITLLAEASMLQFGQPAAVRVQCLITLMRMSRCQSHQKGRVEHLPRLYLENRLLAKWCQKGMGLMCCG